MSAARTLAISVVAVAATAFLHGQARSAPDWTTQGFDAQRTSWMRADPYISLQTLEKFRFIWKLKVDNESRHGNALTSPVTLGNLMTFRGFKSLVFVGGSSNNVYAIDYDFGTLFWKTHHNYAAGAREYAGSPACPGGMTLPLTRAAALEPATQLSYLGFARAPRPAKGDVGEPAKGAPQLAEIAARGTGRGSDAAATPAPSRGAPPPAAAPVPDTRPNFVFSVAADGLLRGLIPDTGDLALAPARLLPANATANGLIWAGGIVYAATSNACGSVPTAVFAMDFMADGKPVTRWDSDGAGIAGLSLGPDGTVYVSTAGGASSYANAVVSLDGRTLEVKDWYTTSGEPFISTPIVFREGETTYVAATTASGIYLLNGASLGGRDHRTPISSPVPAANISWSAHALATWRDASGTRWLLGPATGAIAAYKLAERSGAANLERVWTSSPMVRPTTPIVVNGVVFALAAGREGANAVLYALDPISGKELWTSGTTITAPASAGLSAGTGQVYVVTADNTVWAFGISLAIN